MKFRDIENILIKNGYVLVRTLDTSKQFKKSNSEIVQISGRDLDKVPSSTLKYLRETTGLRF